MCLIFLFFRTVFDQSVDISRKLTLKTENIEKSQNCNNFIQLVDLLVESTSASLYNFVVFFFNKIFINKCNIVLVKVY